MHNYLSCNRTIYLIRTESFRVKLFFFLNYILTKIIWKWKEISCIFVMSINYITLKKLKNE